MTSETRGAPRTVEITSTVPFASIQRQGRSQETAVARAGRASERARLVRLADNISNLRDILGKPPAGWSSARKQKYFDWAKEVVDQVRPANPKLERVFDRLYRQRPRDEAQGSQQDIIAAQSVDSMKENQTR